MPENNQLNITHDESSGPCEIYYDQPDDATLRLGLKGNWKIGEIIPAAEDVHQQLNARRNIRIPSLERRHVFDKQESIA